MPSSKSLILCVHAHQPVGNFGWVFDEAYRRCYFEFFEVLERHPRVKWSCHFSGSLLDWFEAERPEFIRSLRKLIERGQIEIMGGAYYEPIYGMIPKNDLDGQLALMQRRIGEIFGVSPEGAWVAERVWDPDLVKPIRRAGYGYTVLDDAHLNQAGSATQPVTGYVQAQDGGDALDVFASLQTLRYAIPFRAPEEALRFIRSSKSAGPENAFVFADDCEKFGLWPGTHELVYQKKWLERFFTLLERDRNIRTYTFSEYRRDFKPKGAVAIPHGSYREMMQWSGGNFNNFFEKYPESGYAKSRMLSVSGQLSALDTPKRDSVQGQNARTALYRAQCNCSYWHGVFGGLYLHHLRSAVFENLISAENSLRELEKASGSAGAFTVCRLDGSEHLRLEQKGVRSFFTPAYGGSLAEFDDLKASVNLMCTLKRRREAYHDAVFMPSGGGVMTEAVMIYKMLGTKFSGLEKELRVDTHRRLSFMDHFFKEATDFNEWNHAGHKEIGDFVGSVYGWRLDNERLLMSRRGTVELDGKKQMITLNKTIAPDGPNGFSVAYEFQNESAGPAAFTFGAECNFSIGDEVLRRGLERTRTREWVFKDAWRGLELTLFSNEEWELVVAPVETVSESESGLEKTYQGLSALAQKRFSLGAGERGNFTLKLSVRNGA